MTVLYDRFYNFDGPAGNGIDLSSRGVDENEGALAWRVKSGATTAEVGTDNAVRSTSGNQENVIDNSLSTGDALYTMLFYAANPGTSSACGFNFYITDGAGSDDNFYQVYMDNTGDIKLRRYDDAVLNAVIGSPDLATGVTETNDGLEHVFAVKVEANGGQPIITAHMDGAIVGSPYTDVEAGQKTSGKTGFRIFANNFRVEEFAVKQTADSTDSECALVGPWVGLPIQRESVFPIKGYYVGSGSSAEARIVKASGGAEVQGWTTVTGTVTGGIVDGTFPVTGSNGLDDVKLQLRVDGGSECESPATPLGELSHYAGQSNKSRMCSKGTTSWNAPNNYLTAQEIDLSAGLLEGTIYPSPTRGDGANAYLQAVTASQGVPSSVSCAALGDTGLSTEAATFLTWEVTTEKLYLNLVHMMTIMPGRWLLWNQGEADARVTAAANLYATNLPILFSAIRAAVSKPSQLILITETYDPADAGTDLDTVRQAQADTAAADSNITFLPFDTDWPLDVDDTHYTPEGYATIGGVEAELLYPSGSPTLTTPYSRSFVQAGSSGTVQDTGRSAVYTYTNPDNSSSEISVDFFFSGVGEFELKKDDIINATLSDGFFILQMETDTKATVRLS